MLQNSTRVRDVVAALLTHQEIPVGSGLLLALELGLATASRLTFSD